MAHFLPRCNGKHGREMKMKYLNPAENGEFPCKLRSGNLMVSNVVVIVLLEG